MAPLLPIFVLGGLLHASAKTPEPEGTPVLVELFTSEGCSSCPPAGELLAQLAQEQPVRGARVLALGEHVDYWDVLGWKDAFSSPVATRRQQEYVERFHLSAPYTPQVVIGGQAQVPGSYGARRCRRSEQEHVL